MRIIHLGFGVIKGKLRPKECNGLEVIVDLVSIVALIRL